MTVDRRQPPTATRRRASFHPLAVAGVRRLTDDAVEVTFAVPTELAGQYDYLPGQYVALRTTLRDEDGKEQRDPPQLLHLRRACAVRGRQLRDPGGHQAGPGRPLLHLGQRRAEGR